jgi:hypothetical protein
MEIPPPLKKNVWSIENSGSQTCLYLGKHCRYRKDLKLTDIYGLAEWLK